MATKSTKQPSRLTDRGLRTRQRIVTVAAELVSEKGIRGTSLEDIMAEAAVSKSQLYHYFADKGAIVEAVVQYQTREVIAGQLPHLTSIESISTLRRWRNALVTVTRLRGNRGGCPLGALASELADSSERARVALMGGFLTWGAHIEKGLNTMRARGELMANADTKALATAILGAVQGGLLLAKTTRSEEPLALALDMAISHVERFTSRSLAAKVGARPSSARRTKRHERSSQRLPL